MVGSRIGSTVVVEVVGLKICKESVTFLTVGVEVVGSKIGPTVGVKVVGSAYGAEVIGSLVGILV